MLIHIWWKGERGINRTKKSKIQYMGMFLILLALCLIFIVKLINDNKPMLMLIIPIIFLIPGRIQGYYYKDFFKAGKLIGEKNYKESIEYSKKFIEYVKLHSWVKKLIWLSWGMYSKDIEAMTLNNLGIAYLNLGNLKEAEYYFNEAIRQDSLYPMPYFNLSILEIIKGNNISAEELYNKSVSLGFSKTKFDYIIQRSQQILANIEGK